MREHVIDTATGLKLNLDDPQADQIALEDIAGGLARVCRFGAQSLRFHSLNDEAARAWVAQIDDRVAGFVAATLDPESDIGEISMVAVEPDRQRVGIGAALTRTAIEWLRDSGMSVAIVETGGDPGHLPARRTYESTGFTPLAVCRFFMAL